MTRRRRPVRIEIQGVTREVKVGPDGSIAIEGQADAIRVTRADPATYVVQIAERRVSVYLASQGTRGWAFADGHPYELELTSDRPRRQPPRDPAHSLAAPMPASVLTVLVEPGQSVRQGDPLVLLEAMKMEIALRAPHDATVESVNCAAGDLVQPSIPLVVLADAVG